MKWLINNGFLLLIYLVFLGTTGGYLFGVIKYHDVESWPSTNAKITKSGDTTTWVPTQGRYGSSSTTIGASFVEFEYEVAGKRYLGTKATPDGGEAPFDPNSKSPKAYYKPSAPEVAVLAPIPYGGERLLIVAGCFGIMVLFHLGFLIAMRRNPK